MKEQLIKHIAGGEAFLSLDEMLKEVEIDKIGIRPYNLPYSVYELFYHIRFAQKDILDYIKDVDYKTPNWPQDYWPTNYKPVKEKEWDQLKEDFFSEREQINSLLKDPDVKLDSKVGEKGKHLMFREMLLIIEHNAYHTGELLVILRLLNLHS